MKCPLSFQGHSALTNAFTEFLRKLKKICNIGLYLYFTIHKNKSFGF